MNLHHTAGVYSSGSDYWEASPKVAADGTIYVDGGLQGVVAISPAGEFLWDQSGGKNNLSFGEQMFILNPAGGVFLIDYNSGREIHEGEEPGQMYLIGLDTQGKQNLSVPVGKAMQASVYGVSEGSFHVIAGGLAKYISADGTLLWSYQVLDGYGASHLTRDSAGNFLLGVMNQETYDYQTTCINSDGQILWQVSEHGYNEPFISSDGTILLLDHSVLQAVSPKGKVLWRYGIPGSPSDNYFPSYGGIHPAVDSQGGIYIGSASGLVIALTPEGKEKWRFQAGDRSSSPAVGRDGTVYVTEYRRGVYAINPDGTAKWKLESLGAVDSDPAIGSDGSVYVVSPQTLYALDP